MHRSGESVSMQDKPYFVAARLNNHNQPHSFPSLTFTRSFILNTFATRFHSAFLCLLFPYSVSAEVIVSFATPGEIVAGNVSRNIGQSLTTPNTQPYTDISFNFFETFAQPGVGLVDGDPFAEGELFLLTEQYSGTADDLSSATAGFVAQTSTIVAEGAGTEWVFASDVILHPDVTYFFYARNLGANFGTSKARDNGGVDGYSGGDYFQTEDGGSGTNFRRFAGADWRFELEGTAVPEPGSLGLFVVAAAAVVFRPRQC